MSKTTPMNCFMAAAASAAWIPAFFANCSAVCGANR
jgi:hypothetical protein